MAKSGGRPPRKKRPTEPGELGTETSADTSFVNASDKDPKLVNDPLIGQTLGKCKISELIGEGRTAVVYRAVYKPLKRTVAVKVLQPDMTKYPAVVRVFQQEGRAVAALDHENIVKIYDVGEDQGRHYLVLELLRGQDVLKTIEESESLRLPVDDALDFTRQAAAGLAAAGRKKLIHRDIKPQNLVIEPNGALKIVDFGLAAEAEGAFAGGRLGTPHYMSPEVCRGELAGTASDIYALGVTLFHMLVGHAPYAGRKTTEEIVQGHLSGERFYPEKLKKDIPRPVGDLVRKMTRMDPAARPTAKEVVETITDRLTPEKLDARHRVAGRRGASRGRRKQSSTGLYAMIGVVVLLVLGAFVMMGGNDDDGDVVQPDKKPAKPVAEKPKKPVEKKPVEIKDKTLEQTLKDLLEGAKGEEKTGNLTQALLLYQRVLVKAPADSKQAIEAKAAAELVKNRLMAEKKGEARRNYISVQASEKAGKEFAERESEFWKRLTDFEVTVVKRDADALLVRTRKGSSERGAIELVLDRMRYIESLLSIVNARAGSLSGDKAEWSTYDPDEVDDLMIVGADEAGISLKDDDLGAVKVKPWREIEAPARILFLDNVRNPRNGTETLWVGAYCKLLGLDDKAEQYCDFALMLDSSPEMKAEVKALLGK